LKLFSYEIGNYPAARLNRADFEKVAGMQKRSDRSIPP